MNCYHVFQTISMLYSVAFTVCLGSWIEYAETLGAKTWQILARDTRWSVAIMDKVRARPLNWRNSLHCESKDISSKLSSSYLCYNDRVFRCINPLLDSCEYSLLGFIETVLDTHHSYQNLTHEIRDRGTVPRPNVREQQVIRVQLVIASPADTSAVLCTETRTGFCDSCTAWWLIALSPTSIQRSLLSVQRNFSRPELGSRTCLLYLHSTLLEHLQCCQNNVE